MSRQEKFFALAFSFFAPVVVGVFVWAAVARAEVAGPYISAVQITNGPGHTTEDFVELLNPGDQPFNLNGYRLVKRTETAAADTLVKAWTTDEFIPAYGFYLWANSDFTSIAVTPDATTTATLAADNGLAVRNGPSNTGVIVDSLAWGAADNGFENKSAANPEAGQSLVRQELFSLASAFAIAASAPRNSFVTQPPSTLPTTTTPTTTPPSVETPTTTPESASHASSTPEQIVKSEHVKIYRFLPNPSGSDSGNEWVEIINNGEESVLLDAWLLDDTGSVPAPDAFELAGAIAPGEIQRFTLPASAFALNNSGGDEVNLYFADKALAYKAAYTASAYDDGIFEFRAGQWQPPEKTPAGGGGGGVPETSQSQTPVLSPTVNFKLNEIFPNPPGDDAEKEWVEIYNPTAATSSLAGYFLADGEGEVWTSAAWAIPKDLFVPPMGVLAVSLPAGAFSLANSSREKVKLFSPRKQLLDFVIYENAPENRSWAKNEKGEWDWLIPTFGLPNDQAPALPAVIISEILPKPADDGEEFVELFNPSESATDLAGMVLQIGSRRKVFGPGEAMFAGGFLVIYEDSLPVRLSNTGQIVKLSDAFGRVFAEAVYPKAETGFAYASEDGKTYAWTSLSTPGEANAFVLGAFTDDLGGAPDDAKSASVKPAAAPAMTRAQAQALLASNQALESQLAAVQDSLARIQTQQFTARAETPVQPLTDNPPQAGETWPRILGLLTAAVLVSAVTARSVFKFGTKPQL